MKNNNIMNTVELKWIMFVRRKTQEMQYLNVEEAGLNFFVVFFPFFLCMMSLLLLISNFPIFPYLISYY